MLLIYHCGSSFRIRILLANSDDTDHFTPVLIATAMNLCCREIWAVGMAKLIGSWPLMKKAARSSISKWSSLTRWTFEYRGNWIWRSEMFKSGVNVESRDNRRSKVATCTDYDYRFLWLRHHRIIWSRYSWLCGIPSLAYFGLFWIEQVLLGWKHDLVNEVLNTNFGKRA